MSGTRKPERPGRLAFALVCAALPACGSFDPVSVPHFEYLHVEDNPELGITGAHWIAYDDQHSLTSACTNGATGNHDPSQCSTLLDPVFSWTGGKCPKSEAELNQGQITKLGSNGTICIQGELRPLLPCGSIEVAGVGPIKPPRHCRNSLNSGEDADASNMWGAGVGLAFKSGDEGWDATEHGVVGVAFDLSGLTEAKLGKNELNLRVEIPIVLDSGLDLPTMPRQPLMRSDGSVIGTDRKLYKYDCESGQVLQSDPEQDTNELGNVVVGGEPSLLTSELHPLGSPFWQESEPSDWVPSPVKVGHNEFKLSSVLAPRDSNYTFTAHKIVGIHFQVVHGNPAKSEKLPFAFCISNLAVLKE